jgi:hypothetical protein
MNASSALASVLEFDHKALFFSFQPLGFWVQAYHDSFDFFI